MKKNLLLLIFILQTLIAYAQFTFQKTFGGLGNNEGYSVQQTSDGGYIIAGNFYLIKTDSYGDTLWTKRISPGTSQSNQFFFVQQTTDGGYIVTGRALNGVNYDVYLGKTDANGNLLWSRNFGGGIHEDIGNCVRQTSDGGYIIAGYTMSFGSGTKRKVYVIKTDANGDSLWTRAFGGSLNESAFSIQQTTDGGYIISGNTTSFGTNGDAYLIKTDAGGNLLWSKAYGSGTVAVSSEGLSVRQTTDGGYIMTGSKLIAGIGGIRVYLIKTDANGDTLWLKTYGGSNFGPNELGYSVQQTTDGGYVIAGRTSSFGAGNYDAYLIKTDANGDTLWTRTFGEALLDWAYSVQQTTDGGYIISGLKTNSITGFQDIYLIKTDANGNSGCNQGNPATIVSTPGSIVSSAATAIYSPSVTITIPANSVSNSSTVSALCASVDIAENSAEENTIVISPNPATHYLTLVVSWNTSPKKVECYNLQGRQVIAKTIHANENGKCREDLDISNLPAGLYAIIVSTEAGFHQAKKFIKQY